MLQSLIQAVGSTDTSACRDPGSSFAYFADFGTPPGNGLIILEIQKRLTQFLLTRAMRIMHDEQLQGVWKTSFAVEVKSSITIKSTDLAKCTNLAKMIVEAPYKIPEQLDFARLQLYVNARRAEAEDHYWSMREDPSYFLKDVIDHHNFPS